MKEAEGEEYWAALATICHMIQDSYSGSHTLRNRYEKDDEKRNSFGDNMMAIVKFYDYEEQNKDPKWGVKHLYYDQFSTIIGLDKTLCYLYYQKFIKKGGLLTCGVGNKLRMAYSKKDKEYFKKKFLLALHYSLHIFKIFEDIDTIIENKDSKKLEITDIFTVDNTPFELARRKEGEPESLVRATGQQKSLTTPIVEIRGGGKRYLKGDKLDKVNKEDIVTITPMGSPTILNSFLLQPEIEFISKKCSKDKKLKKFCKSENISKIITEFYRIQQNGDSIKKNIEIISDITKVSKDFVSNVLKYHQSWKKDHFLRFDKK